MSVCATQLKFVCSNFVQNRTTIKTFLDTIKRLKVKFKLMSLPDYKILKVYVCFLTCDHEFISGLARTFRSEIIIIMKTL